jgi:hypothetical protein
LKQASTELKKSQGEIESLNKAKLSLEQKEIEMKYKLEWYKADTDRTYKEATAEE